MDLDNTETKLKLQDYLTLCLALEKDSTGESERAIAEFLGKILVKEYLGLKDKTVAGISILSEINENYDAAGVASAIEIGKLRYGLLSYAINLDTDIGILEKTYTVYDMCMKYGLVQTILQCCEKDYNRFCQYVDSMVNASNIYFLIQTASLLNSSELNKWVETMKEMKDALTPEMLQAMEGVQISGSPGIKNLIQNLAEESLENANVMMANKEEKYKQIASDLGYSEEEKDQIVH